MESQANDIIGTGPQCAELAHVMSSMECDHTREAAGSHTLIAHVKATSTGLTRVIARDKLISVENVCYSGLKLMILA